MKDAVKKVRGEERESEHRRTSQCFFHLTTAPPAPVPPQVIAAITVGKDMNALFPDVVNCMRTGASTRSEGGEERPRTHALFEVRRRPTRGLLSRPPARRLRRAGADVVGHSAMQREARMAPP
jgi:hypothetical protein